MLVLFAAIWQVAVGPLSKGSSTLALGTMVTASIL
jgi:hypothetical protein